MYGRLRLCIDRNKTTAVTGRAIIGSQGAGSAAMTHQGGCKVDRIFMARITLRCRGDMRARFGFGGHAVTTRATTRNGWADECVIEHDTFESGRVVASVA